MKPDEGKGEDEGDDEAAGESRRRKPKTKTKSTTETKKKKNGISWVACGGEYLRLCAYQRHREARNNAG